MSCILVYTSYAGRASNGRGRFGPNLNEFVRRFDAQTTKGQGTHDSFFISFSTLIHNAVEMLLSSLFIYLVMSCSAGPGWLKNLYFAYLLVLRAVTKAEPYWKDHQFYTGNSSEDKAVRERVDQIVQAAK